MKIKVAQKSYAQVCALPKPAHKNPQKTSMFFRKLMVNAGKKDLKDAQFEYKFIGIDKIPDEPCLILMNHSAFIDLEIASAIIFPQPFSVVCTSDGFVGKEWLMRNLGCIPTNKFVSDSRLISDIRYALKENRTHVLMYPEASYSFDGTATPLPRKFGFFLKMLGVPVIMIKTEGAFLRDPLYNMLQKRGVKVTAEVSMLFTKEQLESTDVPALDARLDEVFSYDNFRQQIATKTELNEEFRADGLQRVLFRCPYCGSEDGMIGEGTHIRCGKCGADHELNRYGQLISTNRNKEKFANVPDWYAWERSEIRRDVESGKYMTEFDCRILVLRDYKKIYEVGRGRLTHDMNGFSLTGCGGQLNYKQSPLASYSLYADYFWYEIGDVVCIGNNDMLYYCLPDSEERIPVARLRIAAEEMYKYFKNRKQRTYRAF